MSNIRFVIEHRFTTRLSMRCVTNSTQHMLFSIRSGPFSMQDICFQYDTRYFCDESQLSRREVYFVHNCLRLKPTYCNASQCVFQVWAAIPRVAILIWRAYLTLRNNVCMLHNYIYSMRICNQSTCDEHILRCETLFACRIGFSKVACCFSMSSALNASMWSFCWLEMSLCFLLL